MIESDNLFSKRNVIIGCSVGLSIVGISFIIYTNQNKKLYQELWDKIDSNDVGSGANGDWRDIYDYDFWSPMYLNDASVSQPSLDYNNTKLYAQRIYEAGAGLVHNPQDVLIIFTSLKNRSDVAKISQMFNSLKYGDLKNYLKGFMEGGIVSKNYMQDLYPILKKLPK